MEARGTGSLFRLGTDGSVSTLLRGLDFANGVTPTADESALVFAETVGRRLSKYWLAGSKAGTAEPLAVNLPGMPDNLSTGADGRIWCAFVIPANAALERLFPRAPWIRKVVWRLPERILPKIEPRSGLPPSRTWISRRPDSRSTFWRGVVALFRPNVSLGGRGRTRWSHI